MRKLWSPLALADEAQRAHLRRLDAAGAQVRISSAPLPHETIILDRRVAILAGQPSPLGREFTVTTSPVLVGGVYSLFTAAWEAATDLGAYLRGEVPELAPEAREILRALGAGPHRRGGRPAAGHLAAHLPAAGRRADGRTRGRPPASRPGPGPPNSA